MMTLPDLRAEHCFKVTFINNLSFSCEERKHSTISSTVVIFDTYALYLAVLSIPFLIIIMIIIIIIPTYC